jgi:hypothetical protein
LAGLVEQKIPDNLQPHEALQTAAAWIEQMSQQATKGIETKCTQLSGRIGQVETLLAELHSIRNIIAIKTKSLEQHQNDISQTLGKQTADALRRQVRLLEHNQTERTSCASIAKRVREMCEEFDLTDCPACGSAFDDGQLFTRASDLSESDADAMRESATFERARARLKTFEVSNTAKAAVQTDLEAHQRAVQSKLQEIASILEIDPNDVVGTAAEARIGKMKSELDTLRRRLNNRQEEKEKWQARMRALRQELSFHSNLDELSDLDGKLSAGMRDARDLLADYRNLLEQVERLRVIIEQGFKRALDRAIPKLNDMSTDVYQRLTQQLSYERVSVYHDPEKVGDLELRVASEQLPGQDFPINVVNGQANKALHLVPYLVFSQFQSEVLELDLLLIDDPSESFDTSHVSMLVEELLSAAEHAQIVVASHEQEKFQPELRRRFTRGAYTNMSVSKFNPLKGPTLERQ